MSRTIIRLRVCQLRMTSTKIPITRWLRNRMNSSRSSRSLQGCIRKSKLTSNSLCNKSKEQLVLHKASRICFIKSVGQQMKQHKKLQSYHQQEIVIRLFLLNLQKLYKHLLLPRTNRKHLTYKQLESQSQREVPVIKSKKQFLISKMSKIITFKRSQRLIRKSIRSKTSKMLPRLMVFIINRQLVLQPLALCQLEALKDPI